MRRPALSLARLAVGVLVVVLAAAAPAAPATSGPPAGRMVDLRVAAYNIQAGAGADGRFDVGRQIEAMRALDADIIGLQEVDVHWMDRSQWRDVATEIASGLGMNLFFGPIYDLEPPAEGQPRRQFGIALLSRYPILRAENHWITRLSTQVPDPVPEPAPGFPEIVVNVRGAHVHVYGTHLDYRSDPAVRQMQVADTLRIMAEDRGRPQILLGDLNARPDAPELAPLWTHLADAWLLGGSGPGMTYPASGPDRRIDYVTVSPRITVRSVRVPYTLASDHLPVVADLTLARGANGPPSRAGELRYGTPAQAGLLAEHVDRIAPDAAAFVEPGPGRARPFYPGFVVLAARRGVVVERSAGGHAVRYAGSGGAELPPGHWIPMREDTLFDLASISKLFTTVVTMQLVERGLLDLDAPVARYIPEFASNGKQAVTLRHLLTHTAGLPAGLGLDPYPSIPERLAAIYAVPARAVPGTSYLYSDLSLIVVGKVLERVTGKPLDQLVREGISQPLGLRDTMHNPPASLRPRIAPTEWQEGGRGLIWGEVHDRTSWLLGGTAGHAGLFATADDLAVFAQALLGGGRYGNTRILAAASVRTMWTNWNAHLGPGSQRGLGFDMYRHSFMGAMATPSAVGHTGFTGTSLVIDPETDAFVILLTNRVHPTRVWAPDIGQARRAVAGDLARAIAVRPAEGRTAWFADNNPETGTPGTATLTLPVAALEKPARLEFSVWWDTETCCDRLAVETATEGAPGWTPLALTLRAGTGGWQAAGVLSGPGRRWHRASAALPAGTSQVRWRYATDTWLLGRGVYVDAVRVGTAGGVVFEDSRPADHARWQADRFAESPD